MSRRNSLLLLITNELHPFLLLITNQLHAVNNVLFDQIFLTWGLAEKIGVSKLDIAFGCYLGKDG